MVGTGDVISMLAVGTALLAIVEAALQTVFIIDGLQRRADCLQQVCNNDELYAWRGGASLPPTPRKIGCPLDGNVKLYTNHCHQDPVNIFFYKQA